MIEYCYEFVGIKRNIVKNPAENLIQTNKILLPSLNLASLKVIDILLKSFHEKIVAQFFKLLKIYIN